MTTVKLDFQGVKYYESEEFYKEQEALIEITSGNVIKLI